MKNILLIVFILNLGCGAHKDPEPVYTSMEGHWKFQSVDVSGELNIAGGKVNSGYFAIGGTKYTVDTPFEYHVPDHLDLMAGDNNLTFENVTVSGDFKKIISTGYQYFIGDGLEDVSKSVTLTR